jgi:predicted nucleotidyltransferase
VPDRAQHRLKRAARACDRAGGGASAGVDLVGILRRAVESRPEILEAYLFGSRARGEAHAGSDVDFALYAEPIPDTPLGCDAEVAADLMKALATNRVDVVLLPAPLRRSSITRSCATESGCSPET